jgi:NADH-quinone oxidoreductase subunit J
MSELVIFILISAFTLMAGVVVVLDRNLFRAAIALMASFLGVAGIYVLLEAGLLAVAQLLVYIGAISILVIFAIMMTRRLMQTTESPFNSRPALAAGGSILAFVVLVIVIIQTWPASDFSEAPQVSAEILRDNVSVVGQMLVSPDRFVIPFEVASVLLLAALIGAIVIARSEKE